MDQFQTLSTGLFSSYQTVQSTIFACMCMLSRVISARLLCTPTSQLISERKKSFLVGFKIVSVRVMGGTPVRL